jgi:hypothetical protein
MKRLTYFQVHKNKKPKKLPFFISKSLTDKVLEDLNHRFDLFLIMQEAKGDF